MQNREPEPRPRHPRPDLLAAAIHRRPVRLPNGHTGRVQRVNKTGTVVTVVMPWGYHHRVRADDVVLLDREMSVPARPMNQGGEPFPGQ